MRVSIIIPVYNQEKYIEAALSDALGQVYEDIEVVAVNDGSTDSSDLILRKFSDVDDRLKIVNKDNGGLITANSAGIKAASGEYICFLDPDDRIGPYFVSSFVRELDYPYDFIAKGFQLGESADRLRPFFLKENHVFTVEELRALSGRFLVTPSLAAEDSVYVTRWNKMYRKDVLLSFVDEYNSCGSISLCEDVIFLYLLLQHANNGKSCVEVSSYQWYIRDSSMSHTFNFDMTTIELDRMFEKFEKIINRYSGDLTPALLAYYSGLVAQLRMANERDDSLARLIYSKLQNNKRFRKSAICTANYSKFGLSVAIIKAYLLCWKTPFWFYCFTRKVYKIYKLIKR